MSEATLAPPPAAAPVIGISAYSEQARWGAWDLDAVVLPQAYAAQVAAAGGLPVLLPPAAGIEAALARLDGLILSGGGDLDPARYGADRHPRPAASGPPATPPSWPCSPPPPTAACRCSASAAACR